MSWRIITTVFIVLISIIIVSSATAGPINEVTDTLVEIDDGAGDNYDTEQQAESGLRAYSHLILILAFGTIAYGAWYIFRREVSEGQL